VVAGEDVESLSLGLLITVGKVNVRYLEALRGNGMDSHSLLASAFCDQNGNFVHFSFHVLLFLLSLRLLGVLLVVELSGSLDVGEQPHLVDSYGLGEFDQGVLTCESPSSVFKLILIV
jgi:hypothetical protein